MENNRKRDHLPRFGVGPAYVIVIVALTAAGVVLPVWGRLPFAGFGALRLPAAVLGVALAAGGVLLFCLALFRSRIGDSIRRNTLNTTGVYAWTRNPVYSAWLLACTGAVLMAGNAWLLVLPVFHWAFLTLLMKRTEERWLRRLYGRAYEDYCRRVNRCIPWPPRK